MSVWAISDLHLSFARPIRRERFAAHWRDHAAQIDRNWRDAVEPGDLVLLPGDLSMARNHRDLQPDLEWLERLPGTKVLSAGNHDQWWNGTKAIRPLLRRSMLAVGADAVATHGVIVCGTTARLLRPILTIQPVEPPSTARCARWNKPSHGPPRCESIPRLRFTSSGIIPRSTPTHAPVRAWNASKTPARLRVSTVTSTMKATGPSPCREPFAGCATCAWRRTRSAFDRCESMSATRPERTLLRVPRSQTRLPKKRQKRKPNFSFLQSDSEKERNG